MKRVYLVVCLAGVMTSVYALLAGTQQSFQPVKLLVLKGHDQDVFCVAFSPNGEYLVSGGSDKHVRVWNLTAKREVATLSGHSGHVMSVAFSPDGRVIASGSEDGTVKLWEFATKSLRTTFQHGSKARPEVTCVAFSPKGSLLVSSGTDRTIKLWDIGTGKHIRAFSNPDVVDLPQLSGLVCSLAFSPDGRLLVAGDSAGGVKIWDLDSAQVTKTFKAHEKGMSLQACCGVGVAIAQDGKRLATRSGKEIKLWDMATGKQLAHFIGHKDHVSNLAFHPKGSVLASSSYDGTIRFWDATTGKQLAEKEEDAWILAIAFNADGTLLAAGDSRFEISVWKVPKL